MSENYSTMLCLDKNPDVSNKAQLALINKKTVWSNLPNNKITISFKDPNAAWSLIGRQSNLQVPSMNLGWVDPPFPGSKDFPENKFTAKLSVGGKITSYNSSFPSVIKRNGCDNVGCRPGYSPGATILHEFGHALGLYHEHQNYSKIDGKEVSNPVVYKPAEEIRKIMIEDCINFSKEKNGNEGTNCEKTTWPENQIQSNIIERYSSGTGFLNGSCFDPKSIMRYPMDPRFIISGPPPSYNFVYSDMDKMWLQKYYPVDKTILIRVYFIDITENEKWKVYWVIYCLCRFLVPIVGIQFNFFMNLSQNKDNIYLGHTNYIKKTKLKITKDQCEEKFTQEEIKEKTKNIIEEFMNINTIFK